MKSLAKTLILLLALGVFFQPASADEPPNVLFIAVDDLRDWVGHLGGHPQAKTPNIDRLAKRGVSFKQAYCSAPLCNPSRISLLTGVAPANSGDHGWHLGEKEHWRKHALWDVSTRTPLIFVAPKTSVAAGGVARDQLCQRPVSLIDIFPTLIDLCGLPKREELDGHSLQPLLKNPKAEWDRPVVMTYGFNSHAVQTQRWRYIRYRDGGQELYDHSKDPNEWTNLAGSPEYEEVITKLKTALPEINRK